MQESVAKLARHRGQIAEIVDRLAANPLISSEEPLQAYRHLTFTEALAAYEGFTGERAYLPEAQSRAYYRQGRITDDDLSAALAYYPKLQAEQVVCKVNDRAISRKDIYFIALRYDLSAISNCQLHWLTTEMSALSAIQADVPETRQKQLLAGETECDVIQALWASLLTKLELQDTVPHSGAMFASAIRAEDRRKQELPSARDALHEHTRQLANAELDKLLAELGNSISLRGFVLALSGIDILDCVRPQLLSLYASALDDAVAAWRAPKCGSLGLYAAWREMLRYDANLFLQQLPDWQNIIAELPEDALSTIILQLKRMDIAQEQWAGYLQRLMLELPGWSSQINRQQQPLNPQSAGNSTATLADYLAIRLTLDRLWLNQVCHDLWKVEAKVSALQAYFRKNLSEFRVRQQLYQGRLPEYLTQQAEALIVQAGSERQCRNDWQQLADLMLTWRLNTKETSKLGDSGWRLFRLCQHLGLNAGQLQRLDKIDLQAMLFVVSEFDSTERNKIWLYAYENHYRQAFFQVLRICGNEAKRDTRPEAQLIFCMDNREEGFRWLLERRNPAIETLGIAGFYELAAAGVEAQKLPDTGTQQIRSLIRLLHRELRHNPLLAYALINCLAPFALLGLLAKALFPGLPRRISTSLKRQMPSLPLPEIDGKHVDEIAGFLRTSGLSYGYSELIVLMAHTGGRGHSCEMPNEYVLSGEGQSARQIAALLNRPKMREQLTERGFMISPDTWFIGAEHNATDEEINWYDLNEVPAERQNALVKLQADLHYTQQLFVYNARRRLASALCHLTTQGYSEDCSEPRINFEHACHAAAVIGRRALTHGIYFDSRLFLVSYDPTQDAAGKILENVLSTVVPRLVNINLQYYFSTINNEYADSGVKVLPSIPAHEGVIEDISKDLAMGLTLNHEAMRLLVLVETKPEMLKHIATHQKSIRDLLEGGWLYLSAKDPETGEIFSIERESATV